MTHFYRHQRVRKQKVKLLCTVAMYMKGRTSLESILYKRSYLMTYHCREESNRVLFWMQVFKTRDDNTSFFPRAIDGRKTYALNRCYLDRISRLIKNQEEDLVSRVNEISE